jgi:predicted dehydrogenase
MTHITIIGAGDVVQNRYLAAAAAVDQECDFKISDIVDVRPPSVLSTEFHSKGINTLVRFHQMMDKSPDSLIRLLDQEGLSSSPTIIATPSLFHIPYGLALLERGMTVCIEKPFAACQSQVAQFDKVIEKRGTDRLFLLGYYAIEKGLAAFALGNSGNVPRAYLDLLEPSIEPQFVTEIRASLGQVKQIRGVLLEGAGTAGSLDHRSWVLTHSSGGNTVETFYHLVCMVLPFLGDKSRVKIADVQLSRHRLTAQRFHEDFGEQAAETFTAAKLYADKSIEARLVCAKYVPESLHQRWMEIEFENGRAFADFESGTLQIEGQDFHLLIGLRHKTKYFTQFALFAEKIHNPLLRTEYVLFRDALLLTLEIRERGLEYGLNDYDTEDITRESVNRQLEYC